MHAILGSGPDLRGRRQRLITQIDFFEIAAPRTGEVAHTVAPRCVRWRYGGIESSLDGQRGSDVVDVARARA
ncbi:MAG: hypothetical protein BGO98_26705 [Myxococcales bacterium 68-20]|nr:MAG: hypothetical protein BGO98_26705 [Myxococcales bacterium 68-20]